MKHSRFNENSFLNFHNNRLAEKCVVSFIQHFIYDAETQRETFSSLKHTEQTTRKKREKTENAFLYQSRLLSGDGFSFSG
jgi:hypothetical protein